MRFVDCAAELQAPFELVVTPPAQRAISSKLPELVAVAVIDFLTTALIDPQRVGKELRNDLAGIWSARRGTYRVLYRINTELREVVVLRVEHLAMLTDRNARPSEDWL